MPLYSLHCSACGARDVAFRKIDERDRETACECGSVMARVLDAPHVAPDISPYQAVAVDVATGKAPIINSRSAHREFLKRNGYTEVGTERVGRENGEVRGDFNLRGDLASATREVMGKQK